MVRVQRRVGVEVDDRRRTAVRGREHQRVDADLAFLQVPVRPHRALADDLTRGRRDVDPVRQAEERPEARRPRPRRDHDLLAHLDRALTRLECRHGAVVARGEACDLDALEHGDTLAEALVAKAENGLDVEREPALMLVQADRDALRAPVREEVFHVRVDLGLAGDQL